MQTTIASTARFSGFGLHSGAPARMAVHPAPADHGIRFHRTDTAAAAQAIPATSAAVRPSRLCTRLGNESGAHVSTVEHVMAALAGCGITNALIEIDGPEVPILDGSARPFVREFLARGRRTLDAPLGLLRIREPVTVGDGAAWARLEPAAESLEIGFAIDFPDAAIGPQSQWLDMANGTFVRELCDSRTFCRRADIEAMQASGLAQGGTYDNAVVVDGDTVLNADGLRRPDEAVRHKILDAFGDLALAGAPLIGRYTGWRAGHALTHRLLAALFARPAAWQLETCSDAQRDRLPGAGLTREDRRAAA